VLPNEELLLSASTLAGSSLRSLANSNLWQQNSELLDTTPKGSDVNWEALGAVAELLGAAAVVLTLLYLARQMAAQRRALETTIRDSAFRQLQDFNNAAMCDPTLGNLFQQGMASSDWSALSEDDRGRLVHAFFGFFKCYENMFLHRLEGTISEEAWMHNRSVLLLYASGEGGRNYWQKRRFIFDPRFIAMLEAAEAPAMEMGARIAMPTASSPSG
jgi:hypothetical protein